MTDVLTVEILHHLPRHLNSSTVALDNVYEPDDQYYLKQGIDNDNKI